MKTDTMFSVLLINGAISVQQEVEKRGEGPNNRAFHRMDDLITDQKITSQTLIHRKEPSPPFLGLSVSTRSVVISLLGSVIIARHDETLSIINTNFS